MLEEKNVYTHSTDYVIAFQQKIEKEKEELKNFFEKHYSHMTEFSF